MLVSMPRIGCQLIKLIDLFEPHGKENLYRKKYRRINFSIRMFFLKCDLSYLIFDTSVTIYPSICEG